MVRIRALPQFFEAHASSLVAYARLRGSVTAPERVLSVQGSTLYMDGAPIKLYGIRAASATYSQDTTDHLLAQFDDYQAHGINTVTVFFMGSSGGSYDAWSNDGNTLDAGHVSRMQQIAEECKNRGMVLIVGLFYQRAPWVNLTTSTHVENAVRVATQAMQPWRNVIINICNENNSSYWNGRPIDFRQAENVLAMCEVVHEEDSTRLVGGGGYSYSSSRTIGLDNRADILLFDTISQGTIGNSYDSFRDDGVTKPIVNVETFGGTTADIHPTRGVYPPEWVTLYKREIDECAARSGAHTLFHDNRWTQPKSLGTPYTEADILYSFGTADDPIGDGTADHPGWRWFAEYIRDNG